MILPLSPAPADVLVKWCFSLLKSRDWRDVGVRQGVYAQMAEIIDCMRADPNNGAIVGVYQEQLSELTARIEAKADGCGTLADLEKAVATPPAQPDPPQKSAEMVSPDAAAGPAHVGPDRTASEPASLAQDRTEFMINIDTPPTASSEAGAESLIERLTRSPPSLPVPALIAATALGLVVLLMIVLAFTWPTASRTACSSQSTACFDSGWQPVSNRATTVYFFRHRLGAAPRGISIWFSPSADGSNAFPLLWKFQRTETGNPVSIEVRSDLILLNIWSGVPLFGAYDASKDAWTTYTDGYYRVVADH